MNKTLLYIWILLLLSMHLFGISRIIGDVRGYDLTIGFIKADMLIHFTNSFFMMLLLSKILKKYLAILVVMGIGAMFEIIELVFVVFFDSSDLVGDYMNNALDGVFNLLGALVGSLL